MSASGGQRSGNRWRIAPAQWIAALRQHEGQLLLVLALVIGALTGAVVVAFILLTERLGMRLYPEGSAAWRRVLIPTFGSLAMGYLLFRYFPDARGSGVPQTKAALFARRGVITSGTTVGKFFCTAATLATGIPLGREGPSVQVGAGIASVLGRRLGLSAETVKALIPMGAAAAIAAAFNTPLAGVLFSLEEVMGDLNAPMLGSVVLASAVSWAVLRLLLGDNPLFKVPHYQVVHALSFVVYAVLGIAGGLVSVTFTRLLLSIRERFVRMPASTQRFQPVAGGLLTGLLGWSVPQVLGVGYGYVGDALNGRLALKLMALLVVLKLLASAVSYASGNAGGIFGPSLFIGAMLGGTVGGVAHSFWPTHTAPVGAFALVGMGTAFAGIVRAPMTSVVMIFETTRDYEIIVPLMISNLLSFFISSRLQPQPIYEALSLQDGVHLPSVQTSHSHVRHEVIEVMRAATEMLPSSTTVGEALERAQSSEFHAWPVTDKQGVVGVVGLAQLRQALAAREGSGFISDLIDSRRFPHVHADQPLHLALERMSAAKLDVLPVVSRDNVHRMEGIVVRSDILTTYSI